MVMALHPEAQARAQEEIDSVVGRDRLHTFQDRDFLPYTEHVFKESLRWGTPAPLCEHLFERLTGWLMCHMIAVPHRLIQDDVYKNYILPTGTIVSPSRSVNCSVLTTTYYSASGIYGILSLQTTSDHAYNTLLGESFTMNGYTRMHTSSSLNASKIWIPKSSKKSIRKTLCLVLAEGKSDTHIFCGVVYRTSEG
jgi:hypothetical protein